MGYSLKNKNILLVIHQGCLGGAERQALGLGKYLSQQCNCNVDLLLTFSSYTTKEFDDYVKESGINNVLHFGTPYLNFKWDISILNVKRIKWSIEYLLHLRKEIKKYNPEIIIPFLNFPSKVSYYLYKLVPSVKFTFWHQLGLDTLSLDVFEKIAVNNVPCVIGNAPNCLQMFEYPYHLKREKLNVLTQNITLEKIIKAPVLLREKFNVPRNSVVIGMIAHFRVDKYHDLLLDAFINLANEYTNAHLLFLGNKENNLSSKEKYLKLIKKVADNNLEGRVTILSNENVNEVLNILDIGVLVSLTEGTPNVVMEYMLYELPVIASKHPGCINLLKNSNFLIENSKDDLINKLIQLIENESVRRFEGSRNLELIKKYDVATYVAKLETIIGKYI